LAWWRTRHEFPGGQIHLFVRNGAVFPHLSQSLISPVLSTSLYFVVFGAAIGSRIDEIDGVSYGAFIVPGLIMLSVLTQSISNASFGIYFPKFLGSIYELHTAPVSFVEIVLGYVGAAATKSALIGLVILARRSSSSISRSCIRGAMAGVPGADLHLVQPVRLHHRHLGEEAFEQLQMVPLLVITPLVFLGGSFYSISMLPPVWQTVTLFNPVVYLISGFRWAFYGTADINIGISLMMISVFMLICLGIIGWTFKTGYKIKT
jgi:ABC-2 type transport system permease protein